LEMLTDAIRTGSKPPERRLIIPESMPSLQELAAHAAKTQTAKLQRSAGA
jgi:hypothetical protein